MQLGQYLRPGTGFELMSSIFTTRKSVAVYNISYSSRGALLGKKGNTGWKKPVASGWDGKE